MRARLFLVASSLSSVVACGSPTPSGGADPAASAPAVMPRPRIVHGFPIPSTFAQVCSAHAMGAPGSGQIRWDLYASVDEVGDAVVFYRRELPGVTAEAEHAGGYSWRIPNAATPEHVLTVYPPSRADMPSCGTAPPTGARSLANISTMDRP